MEFNLQIVPYVADEPLVAANSYIRISEAEKYIKSFVAEIQKSTDISTPEGLRDVESAQGKVQYLLKQIEAATVLAKSPLNGLLNAVSDVSDSLSTPVLREKERLTGLLAQACQIEKDRRDSIKRAADEAHRKDVESKRAEELRLQEEVQRLKISYRDTMDLDSWKDVLKAEDTLLNASYELDLAENAQVIHPKITRPLVEGARSVEDIQVSDKIDSVLLLVQKHDFIRDVVTFSPIKNAIKAKFKRLRDALESKGVENPTKEAIDDFAKTGFTITVSFKPQVRTSARIVEWTE